MCKENMLRVIGVGLVMNISAPWTSTWAAPPPVEPRLALNTFQVPALQWGADEGQTGTASLPGGVTLTVDATLPLGWFTLSHPDWVGDLSCNMSVIVDNDAVEASYTIVVYDHDGVVVDVVSGTISQDPDSPSDARVGLVRHSDGVSAEVIFQPSLARATIIGEQVLTPVSGGYGSDDGSRIAPGADLAIILVALVVFFLIWLASTPSYNCTNAWSRWWNNCQ